MREDKERKIADLMREAISLGFDGVGGILNYVRANNMILGYYNVRKISDKYGLSKHVKNYQGKGRRFLKTFRKELLGKFATLLQEHLLRRAKKEDFVLYLAYLYYSKDIKPFEKFYEMTRNIYHRIKAEELGKQRRKREQKLFRQKQLKI